MVTGDVAATTPPPLTGLDPAWSRLVAVPDGRGGTRTWHVLDVGPPAPTEPAGTLLCVHGNPTWSYLWRRLAAAPPPAWRVVAPDQLGMGYSERLPEPRTLAERIEDLGLLTDVLGITGPVVIVAHDWGGAISLGWALEHRDLLRGVVLTNTAVHQPSTSAPPVLIRMAHAPGVRHAACVATPTFVRAATALSRPPLPRAVRNAFAAPYDTPSRRRAVADFVADIPFSPDHPSRPALDRVAEGVRDLDVPALLLWGPRDPVFGEPYLEDLRERLPQAQVHRFEWASHLLPEDAPEYAEALRLWVTDLEAASTSSGPGAGEDGEAGPMLWDALDDRAEDREPAVVEVGGVSVGWSQLSRRTREIAAGLLASGVARGDRVALLVPPSADLTAAVYAVWRAGGVVVVADRGLGLRGMGRALRGARVSHVIGTAQGLAAARAMRLPATRIAAGPVSAVARRALGVRTTLADLAALGRSLGDTAARVTVTADDECAVLFTSGATGPAKGVVYRHRQAQAQLSLLRTTYGLGPADRIVAAFAPFALLGPGLGVASAVPAVDVTAPGTLTAAALADAVQAVGATVVFASPAALRNVAATAGETTSGQRDVLRRVRLLMSAGAPVPPALLREVRAVLPRASAHTPYGMTEALPVTDVTLEEIEDAGPGEGVCVGRPLPGVRVAISPLESGTDGALTTNPGVPGEICVSASHVKDRYDSLWATQRTTARPPGWHRTGDVGHLDGEGRLWVEGRLAHVVRTADGVVTPVGPEQRVEALPGVLSAAVVGVGPAGAQQVVVVVVPDGAASTRDPLADLGLADDVRRVAGVPVAAVLQRATLPVDIRHQSKIDRLRLGEWAAGVLGGP